MRFDDVIVGRIEWIARLAFRFCKNKADVDDLAQETIYRIYANRDKFNNACDFKPWALTIMANIAKAQYARKACIPFLSLDDEFDAPSTVRTDSEANYHDILDAIHRSAQISVGVRCVLLYADGYSYEEIANIVGIKCNRSLKSVPPRGLTVGRFSIFSHPLKSPFHRDIVIYQRLSEF